MILGIDIGSAYVSAVTLSSEGDISPLGYRPHSGRPRETLIEILSPLHPRSLTGLCCSSSSPDIVRHVRRYNEKTAVISACRYLNENIGSVLSIGAERFFLISFDLRGTFKNIKGSSSCAAGTGSFLDQQAQRLNINGGEELARYAVRNNDRTPIIASRCSVFAKTDLIHAQQEGYSVEAICDGLCRGLARTIIDTVLTGTQPPSPLVLTGGVALNQAVVEEIRKHSGLPLTVSPYPQFIPAIGACLEYREESLSEEDRETVLSELRSLSSFEELLREKDEGRSYYHLPLNPPRGDYPDFSDGYCYLYKQEKAKNGIGPVEVEIFSKTDSPRLNAFLGIDIGSTSTKAALCGRDAEIYAGFYTRTAGKPAKALAALFEAIRDMLLKTSRELKINGAAVTGSGRKFIGALIGADLIIDEISAHARAAFELNPSIDTIIEIGGQDAKYTSLRNGSVTFAHMNTVCAAGTGSFLEEQARRLGVGIGDYAASVEGCSAPLTSDRCTVFMERDINYFLNRGYSVNELLAASLHSVRDNYLQKVAQRSSIGNRICFQGATGKNKALVAAFERELGKPIEVSRYCHLTGAYGAALVLADQFAPEQISSFRGINALKGSLSIRNERCSFCKNHCRLQIAQIDGEKEAYGFLCGRDYKTKHYVEKQKTNESLLLLRRKIRSLAEQKIASGGTPDALPTIGIPSSLYLYEELPLWRYFFASLGFHADCAEDASDCLQAGRALASAEFCAPVTELHGSVVRLLEYCDYVFLPHYIETPCHGTSKTRKIQDPRGGWEGRNYCFYTQFIASVIRNAAGGRFKDRIMSPLIGYFTKNRKRICRAMLHELNTLCEHHFKQREVQNAYDRAVEHQNRVNEGYKDLFHSLGISNTGNKQSEDITIVLCGRPYTVLRDQANKNIPAIIERFGVRAFFQDMLPAQEIKDDLQAVLSTVPWYYASEVLKAAAFCSSHDGFYPVFITSFKCSPDSMISDYFKRIMETAAKPYLILQVDEHDSSVGYETRIEAALRSFRNHADSKKPAVVRQTKHLRKNPAARSTGAAAEASARTSEDLRGRTLLFPSWDPITNPLLAANLRAAGIDARLLEESPLLIRAGLKSNSGQCIPANIIAAETVRYMEKHRLDPSRCALWMVRAGWTCNIALYPEYLKMLLEAEGRGFEQTEIYAGDFTFLDFSPRVTIRAYFAYLFGGFLRRIGCRIRPYELYPGSTNRAIENAVSLFRHHFEHGTNRKKAIEEALSYFEHIPRTSGDRPKVALFGDFYVRDNEIFNNNLIEAIEAAGAEVVTTPYSDYVKIIASAYLKKFIQEGSFGSFALYRSLLAVVELLEKKYYAYFEPALGPRCSSKTTNLEQKLRDFSLKFEHSGESYDNILKIFHLIRNHPDLCLFVQASPAFCCPSIVSEALSERVLAVTGIPVVQVTFDGTGSLNTDSIVPYIKYTQTARKENRFSYDKSS